MTTTAPPRPSPGGLDAESAGKPGTRDQWILWWSIPVFYQVFGLIFVVLARVMPPPPPGASTAEAAGFFVDHSLTIKIGFCLLLVAIGFGSWTNGLVLLHMKRMSVGSAWAYTCAAALAVAALPGCLFAALTFLAAVLRPERAVEQTALLYDMALLSFVGSLGCFTVQYLCFALAILLDKNKIFPTWLAYVSVWQIFTEILAAPVFVMKDGPFAWDGSIAFWQGTLIFTTFQGAVIYLLRRAIRERPASEPDRDH